MGSTTICPSAFLSASFVNLVWTETRGESWARSEDNSVGWRPRPSKKGVKRGYGRWWCRVGVKPDVCVYVCGMVGVCRVCGIVWCLCGVWCVCGMCMECVWCMCGVCVCARAEEGGEKVCICEHARGHT